MTATLLYILLFALGVLAGFLIAKRQPVEKRVQGMETLLRDLQARHDDYQQQVGEHFQQTAELVNQLTNSYKALHDHLVQGASTLADDPRLAADTRPAKAFVMLDSLKDADEPPFSPYHYPEPNDAELIEPPRDYATKKPDDKGTLDERFGFK